VHSAGQERLQVGLQSGSAAGVGSGDRQGGTGSLDHRASIGSGENGRVTAAAGHVLDQVTITVADFDAAVGFYDASLGALGLVRTVELVDEEEEDADVEAIGWGNPDGPAALWIVRGRMPTSGLHVRLAAASSEAVRRFHDAALAAGGTSHDAPRRWAIYRRGEYNAIVSDPDGNLIEAVAGE
jgi:catechol 2,3-dioxygenase-like lactoylglutathione lyase family enzyme